MSKIYAFTLSFLGIILFSGSTFADHCDFIGLGGMCYFDTFYMHDDAEVDFYCDTTNAVLVSMINHNVLIGGFITDRGAGAGKFTHIGPDTKAVLDQYYFTARNDPGHNGVKHVLILALGTIDCKIGKGGRSTRFPGLFGHES